MTELEKAQSDYIQSLESILMHYFTDGAKVRDSLQALKETYEARIQDTKDETKK